MKLRYEKPFVTIKRYAISEHNMADPSTQNDIIYDAGAITNPQYTLGTLND